MLKHNFKIRFSTLGQLAIESNFVSVHLDFSVFLFISNVLITIYEYSE